MGLVNSKYAERKLSHALILVLELQDAMDKLDWCVNKVTYEVVVHHDVPNKEDGYIVIRKNQRFLKIYKKSGNLISPHVNLLK